MTLELVPWRGAQVPLLSRATLDEMASWVGDAGRYIGPPMPTMTYGARPAEAISYSFEGFVRGMLYADGPVASVEAYRLRVFGQAPLLYQELVDGRAGDWFDDDTLERLRSPWPGATLADLMKRSLTYGDFGGNAFILDLEDELVLVRPDWVEIVLEKREYRGGQVGWKQKGILYHEGGLGVGEGVPFLPGEYAHFVPGLPDPLATYRGMSWLTPLVREIQADKGAADHKALFFENAASPNLAVSLPKEITPKQFEEFVEKMDSQHRGVRNAYKTLYTAGGADVTVVGANMREMDFSAVQGKGESRIANAGGVPPTLLSFSEGMQGSSLNAGNYTAAKRNFVDTTMRDLWANFSGSLQQMDAFKPPRDKCRLWYDGRDIPFLHEDAKDLAEIQQQRATTINGYVQAGWTPDTSVTAVAQDDVTLLQHSGLMSVQLVPPGQTKTPPAAPTGQAAPAPDGTTKTDPTATQVPGVARSALDEIERKFNPDQVRDPHSGEWTDVPGSGLLSFEYIHELYGQQIDEVEWQADSFVGVHERDGIILYFDTKPGSQDDHARFDVILDGLDGDAARALADQVEGIVSGAEQDDGGTPVSPIGLVDWSIVGRMLVGYDQAGDISLRVVGDDEDRAPSSTRDQMHGLDGLDTSQEDATALVEALRELAPLADEAEANRSVIVDAFDWISRGWSPAQELAHPRNPRGGPGGGRFRSLTAGLAAALHDFLKGDGPDNPLDGFNKVQLRKAAVSLGLEPRRGALAPELKDLLLAHARQSFREVAAADKAAPKVDGKFTLKGLAHRNKDVAVFHEPDGKVSLYEESGSGARGARVVTVGDLAGLERWADANGEYELANWAQVEGAPAPAKAVKKAGPAQPRGSRPSEADLKAAATRVADAYTRLDERGQPVKRPGFTLNLGAFNDAEMRRLRDDEALLAKWAPDRPSIESIIDSLDKAETADAPRPASVLLAHWARAEGGTPSVPTPAKKASPATKAAPATGHEALDSVPVKATIKPNAHMDSSSWTATGFTGLAKPDRSAVAAVTKYLRAPWFANQRLRDPSVPLHDQSFAELDGGPVDTVKAAKAAALADRHIAALDRVMAQSSLPQDIVTYRGVDLAALDGLPDSAVGHSWTDPGFVSTATSRDVAENDFAGKGKALLRITAPEGTPALGLDGLGESEVLLGRGLTYRVTADHGLTRDGAHLLDVEILPSDGPAVAAPDKPAPRKAVPKGDLTGVNGLSSDPAVRDVQVENRIREAYRDALAVADANGRDPSNRWVSLAVIRDALGEGLPRKEVDANLIQMAAGSSNSDKVRIIPIANMKGLSQAERDSALRMGGENHHAIAMDDPSPRPLPTTDQPSVPAKAAPKAATPKRLRDVVTGDVVIWEAPGEVPTLGRVTREPGKGVKVDWSGGRREHITTAQLPKETHVRVATPAEIADHGPIQPTIDAPAAPSPKPPTASTPDATLATLRDMPTETRRDALDLRKMDELKTMLRESGLPVSGRKRDLVDRLVGHLDGGSTAPAKTASAKDRRVATMATRLHEDWRKTRLQGDGSFEPRIKATKDEAWIAAHGTDQVDIANTDYADLPEDWKAENRAAAEVIDNILQRDGGKVDLGDKKVRDQVGEEIHQEWLKRNDWAKGGELDVPFVDLPKSEQDKDIDQLRVAMGGGDAPGAAKKAAPPAAPGQGLEPGYQLHVLPALHAPGRYNVKAVYPDGSEAHVIQNLSPTQARRELERLKAAGPAVVDAEYARNSRATRERNQVLMEAAALKERRTLRRRQLQGGGPVPPREQLAAQGLDTSGSTAQLINRLLDAEGLGSTKRSTDPGPEDDDVTRAAGHDTTSGHDELHHYWTRGEGLAKWIASPTQWTTLEHLLEEHVPPEQAKRMAAAWVHEVTGNWPGSDAHRVAEGGKPHGHNIGPG